MQGIQTTKYGRYRIRATCDAKTIIVNEDPALNNEKNHRAAALALATALGWSGNWRAATVPSVSGMVWVCDNESDPSAVFTVPTGTKT